MINIYIPSSIYERLPSIYMALAVGLFVTPLGPGKWLGIATLVAAAAIIRRWRRDCREAEQLRRAAEITRRYRERLSQSSASEPTDSVEVL